MAMHMAEVLGKFAPEEVRPAIGDTDSIGYSSGAGRKRCNLQDGLGLSTRRPRISSAADGIDRAAHHLGRVDSKDVEYKLTPRPAAQTPTPELRLSFKQSWRRS